MIPLVGGDVDAAANGLDVGTISVTSDITLSGGATGVGAATRDLSLSAPGNIAINGNAIGIDIALLAGGDINTDALTARDDIALIAGATLNTSVLNLGATIGLLGPTESVGAADPLLPPAFAADGGHDLALSGQNLFLNGGLPSVGDDLAINLGGGLTLGFGTLNVPGSLLLMSTGGGLTLLGTTLIAGESISLSAAANGVFEPGSSVQAGQNIDLTFGGDLDVNAGTFTAGGSITGVAANAQLSNGSTLDAGQNILLSLTGDFSADGSGVFADGSIGVASGGLAEIVNGAVFDAGQSIVLTAGPAVIVDSSSLFALQDIGVSAGGDIILNSAVLFTPQVDGNSVTLTSTSGSIDQSFDTLVITDTLAGSSPFGPALFRGTNDIDEFDFTIADGLELHVAGDFTVTSTSQSTDFYTIVASGDITVAGGIAAQGDVTFDGANIALNNNVLVANGGALQLFATGDITQTGSILAGTLTGNSSGATSLTSATNDIDALQTFTANGFAYTDADALTVVGPINGGAGVVAIGAGGLLTVDADVTGNGVGLTGAGVALAAPNTVDAGAGTITVDANGGSANLAGTLTTTNGTALAVQILDASNAALGAITTGAAGTVTIGGAAGDAIDGDVTQTGALVTGTVTGNVSGSAALTNAGNQVTNLGAFSSNGLTLVDAGGGLTVVGAVDGGGGGIGLATTGDLLVNATLDSASGPITLAAAGIDSDIQLAAAVTAPGGSDTDGTVTLVAGGTIAQTAAGIITAETLTGSSGGATTLNAAPNAIANVGPFSAVGFALLNADALTVVGDINAGAGPLAITVNGQPLTLNADLTGSQVALVASGIAQAAGSDVNAGAGTILLDANDGAITLAGTLATTSNDAAAVRIIDAGATALGNITTGAAGTVTLGAAGADALGAVSQAGGTAIVTGTLAGNSTGAVTLLNAGNQIANLAGFTANGLSLRDSAGGLAVTGAVNAGAGPLLLQVDAGNLALGADLTTTGAVTLTATGGAVTQSAGRISAGSVGGTSSGGATLNAAANQFATLSGWTNSGAGGVTIVDSVALTITGNVAAGSGNLSITGPGINFAGRTLTAGGTATLAAGTGALVGGTVTAAGGITGTGASIDLDGAAASGGALSLTAATGNLTLDTGSASTTATLAGNLVTIGTLNGGTVATINARDLNLTTLTASQTVNINNTGTNAISLGDVSGAGMNLSAAEVNGITTPTLNIQSGANAIAIGELALAAGAGSGRVNLLTTGRVDVTGGFTATGSTASREIQIGGSAEDTGEASVLRVAATADGGGRLLMDQAVLHLRANKIGVGQDLEFLEALGLVAGGTPASVDTVAQDYVGDATSRLYVAANPYQPDAGGPAVLVSASSMTVTYNDYALFQNTSLPGTIPSGVTIGSDTAQGSLTLNSSGTGAANAFAMSAEINGRRGVETAVLGPNFIILNGVNLNNSRLNGCIVGSGANCIINIVATPFFNFFDESRADVLSAGRDLTLTLDPVVGANNEALFSGISSIDDEPVEDECVPEDDKPCPPKQETVQ